MSWTFAEALETARQMLDRDYDWQRASLSMSYAPEIGWLFSLKVVELTGYIERFHVSLSVGEYEQAKKDGYISLGGYAQAGESIPQSECLILHTRDTVKE